MICYHSLKSIYVCGSFYLFITDQKLKTLKNKVIDWLTTVLVTVTLFGVVLVLVAMMCSSKYQYQPTPAHKEITTYVGVTIFFSQQFLLSHDG